MGSAAVDVGLLVIRGSEELIRQKLQRLLRITMPKVRQKLYVRVEEMKSIKELLPAIYLNASTIESRVDLRVILDRQRKISVDRVFYDEVKDPGHPTFPMLREEKGSNITIDNLFTYQMEKPYEHVVMGGTFDRLHNGHKVLLSEAVMLARDKITCGVTDGKMNEKKILWELLEPIEKRCSSVIEFVEDISGQVKCEAVPIYDAYGPSTVGNHFQAIVVSEETLKGGEAVNAKRKENGFNALDIHIVKLLENGHSDRVLNEVKISSSLARRELLGTVLREPSPQRKSEISDKHYVIGLTGGIASGKTHIAKYLAAQGCEVIDCDTLVHQLYAESDELREKLTQEFGPNILENRTVNRKELADIVFGNKQKLNQLNALVWPIVAKHVAAIVKKSKKQIAVIDAALLLEAGWENSVHQVWTVFVSREEAIKRVCARDGVSEEKACERIDNQLPNVLRIARSNVVFCSFWDYSDTERQVQKALDTIKADYVPKMLKK